MTNRDYILIAHALALSKPPKEAYNPHNTWLQVINAMCDILSKDNPRFDRAVFIMECFNLQHKEK